MTVLEQSNTRDLVRTALDGFEFDLPDGRTCTVRGFATMPPAPQPLDAWPQWEQTEWVNAYAHRTTWGVVVLLPQGMPEDTGLDDAIAAHIGAQLAQLGAVIGPAQPIGLRTNGGTGPTLPAVSITVVI